MTQAQIDIQNQLEQTNNTDLTTQLFLNDSPVLFLEAIVQDTSVDNPEQNSSNTGPIEHLTPPEKHRTPPETNNYEQSLETTPPAKK